MAERKPLALVSGNVQELGAGDTVPEANIPASIARDSEVTTAISNHEGAADPHMGYQKESEKDQANGYCGLDAGGLIPDAKIPSAIARDSEVATAISNHAGAADPHTGYRLESADHTHQSSGAQAGKLDHGLALTGLADDGHAQYALLAGRAGGQTLIGGVNAGNNLTLSSSAHGTKGKILLGTLAAYDEVNNRFGIGTQSPNWDLHIVKAGHQADMFFVMECTGDLQDCTMTLQGRKSDGTSVIATFVGSETGLAYFGSASAHPVGIVYGNAEVVRVTDIGMGIGQLIGQGSYTAGRKYFTVSGSTLGGVVEFLSGQADADANLIGLVQYTDKNSTATDKRVAIVGGFLEGATANKRGGKIVLYVRPNNTDTLTAPWALHQDGTVRHSGNLISPNHYGGEASGGNLTFNTTAHATKGAFYFGTNIYIHEAYSYMWLPGSLYCPTIYGSNAANGDLQLVSTSDATKTSSYIYIGAAGTSHFAENGSHLTIAGNIIGATLTGNSWLQTPTIYGSWSAGGSLALYASYDANRVAVNAYGDFVAHRVAGDTSTCFFGVYQENVLSNYGKYAFVSRNVSGGECAIYNLALGDLLKITGTVFRAPGIYNNTANTRTVYVNADGKLGYNDSTIENKEAIQPIDAAKSSKVYDLNPIEFEYKERVGERQFGLIAEEVADIFPEVVYFDPDEGDSLKPVGLDYSKLVPILIAEVKRLNARISALET